MTGKPGNDWRPDPQLLSAYFDGELDGRADLADLREHIQTWLENHPEGFADARGNRRLDQAILDTVAAEPAAETWEHLFDRIDAARKRPAPTPRQTPARHWWSAGATAAGIALVFGILFAAARYAGTPPVQDHPVTIAPPAPVPLKTRTPEEAEVFEVAEAHEVVILRVEGADVSTLVVGLLPLQGALELAEAGDIRVVTLRPADNDQMVPEVIQNGPSRPVIWARTDPEVE